MPDYCSLLLPYTVTVLYLVAVASVELLVTTVCVCVQSGGELSVMEVELGRRFIEGEQERIQQEKLEKKQAEQVAAGRINMAMQSQCSVR